MSVYFTKISDTAIMPMKANESDAGYDLYCANSEGLILHPMDRRLIDTGLVIALAKGHVGIIHSRSGIAYRNGLIALTGVIDEGYRGVLGVLLFNLGNDTLKINPGDRVAQLLVMPVASPTWVQVASPGELPVSDRGTRGFGSSGQ